MLAMLLILMGVLHTMESFPGANVLLLGSGIDIMQGAMEKAKLEGVSTPPFVEALDMKTLKNLIKTAKTVHDQKLGTVKRYGVYNCITDHSQLDTIYLKHFHF